MWHENKIFCQKKWSKHHWISVRIKEMSWNLKLIYYLRNFELKWNISKPEFQKNQILNFLMSAVFTVNKKYNDCTLVDKRKWYFLKLNLEDVPTWLPLYLSWMALIFGWRFCMASVDSTYIQIQQMSSYNTPTVSSAEVNITWEWWTWNILLLRYRQRSVNFSEQFFISPKSSIYIYIYILDKHTENTINKKMKITK